MKLLEALNRLHDSRNTYLSKSEHNYIGYAEILINKVANRLLAQRKILIGLLIATVGYGITLTLIATEVINENQKLTYDLNVSQTAFIIQSNTIKTRGLCLPRLEMK